MMIVTMGDRSCVRPFRRRRPRRTHCGNGLPTSRAAFQRVKLLGSEQGSCEEAAAGEGGGDAGRPPRFLLLGRSVCRSSDDDDRRWRRRLLLGYGFKVPRCSARRDNPARCFHIGLRQRARAGLPLARGGGQRGRWLRPLPPTAPHPARATPRIFADAPGQGSLTASGRAGSGTVHRACITVAAAAAALSTPPRPQGPRASSAPVFCSKPVVGPIVT